MVYTALEIESIIQKNKYRNELNEILHLCAGKDSLTKKELLSCVSVSPAKMGHMLYLLESLGLLKTSFVGRTMIVYIAKHLKG